MRSLCARIAHRTGISTAEMTDDMRIVLHSDVAVARRVLEIQHSAYAVEADLVGYDSIPPLHETLAELQSQPLIFLGVSCDRTLAGVLGYRRQGDAADIDRLAIHPRFFRRGLATKLLHELFVRERDATRFTVSTGFGNGAALSLYERFGFVVVGEDEPVPGERTVLLEHNRQAFV